MCVPIEKAAMNGKFKYVRHFFQEDRDLVKTAITKHWATALHVAAGANNIHFVEELVKIMDSDQLALQDCNGNTAFFFAAANGNKRMAEIMFHQNESLPTIRGKQGVTPLHLAVIQGRSEMASLLYSWTRPTLQEQDFNQLFLVCVNNGIYGGFPFFFALSNRNLGCFIFIYLSLINLKLCFKLRTIIDLGFAIVWF